MQPKDCRTRLDEQRLWYRNNLERCGNAPRREAKRSLVRSVMHLRPCADCGVTYPWYVMTLDDRSGRRTDVLKEMVRRKASSDAIIEWVKQCDAVCLNR